MFADKLPLLFDSSGEGNRLPWPGSAKFTHTSESGSDRSFSTVRHISVMHYSGLNTDSILGVAYVRQGLFLSHIINETAKVRVNRTWPSTTNDGEHTSEKPSGMSQRRLIDMEEYSITLKLNEAEVLFMLRS